MNLIKRIASLILAILLLTALFAGCGNKKTEESPGAINPGKPVMGGDLTVGIAEDLDAVIDPHKMSSAGIRALLFNVYEGLVKISTDSGLVPAIAEKYEISDTGDVFTFTLRENVKFHNGKTVTVEDVVYSLRRASGLDTGEKPLVKGLDIIASVEATDERTVVVTLKEPGIEALAYLTAAIIPAGSDPAAETVGTGPFKFVSRVPQESILIEKFNDYWGTPAYLDSVTYSIIDNGQTMVMSLMSGALDMVAHLTSAQLAELGSGFNVVKGTMNLVQAVYLNNAVAPFDNADVRRALSYAIDKRAVLDFVWDGGGEALGSSVYPAFSKYFREDLVDYYEYDIQKAKDLLADAGYPDGFEMTIIVPSNYQPHIDTATVVAEQLKQIGVTVDVQLVDWATWLSDTYAGRNFQATICGFDSAALAPRALLERFGSTNGSNFINFNNAEYDEVLARAIVCTDDAEQIELYGRLQEILTEEAANLYIQDPCDIIAMQENVGGYELYPLYVMDMSKVYFTE